MDKNSVRLYIHLPFCRSKCWYCAFNSVVCDDEVVFARYLKALRRHAMWFKQRYAIGFVDSIYIGGGTPSFYPVKFLDKVFSEVLAGWRISADAEVSIEANPADITRDWLAFVRGLGINRISIGVQSLDDFVLKFLGRAHNSEKARRSVFWAKDFFPKERVSIDMIYGLPEESEGELMRRLDRVFTLDVGHISAYMLSVETNNPEVGQDAQAGLYKALSKELERNGFLFYELSNYARPGAFCRHNLGYWTGEEFIGLGAGAWSFMSGCRFAWDRKIERYISEVEKGPVEFSCPENLYKEIELLKLRTYLGAKDSIIADTDENRSYLDMLVSNGFMRHKNGRYFLTLKGRLLADEISGRLL